MVAEGPPAAERGRASRAGHSLREPRYYYQWYVGTGMVNGGSNEPIHVPLYYSW
jgi:hypothetical protein